MTTQMLSRPQRDHVELVRDLIVAAGPKRFRMSMWSTNDFIAAETVPGFEEIECGTAQCFAGWSIVASGHQKLLHRFSAAAVLYVGGGQPYSETQLAAQAIARQAAESLGIKGSYTEGHGGMPWFKADHPAIPKVDMFCEEIGPFASRHTGRDSLLGVLNAVLQHNCWDNKDVADLLKGGIGDVLDEQDANLEGGF